MQVEAVRLEGRELILTLPGPGQEARRLAYTFKPGNYELIKKSKRRSLDANSYLWLLCDKIASSVGISKEEVYRQAVRDAGKFLQCHVGSEDLKRFIRAWESQGTGYQVQIVGNTPAYVIINAYYGTHLYDSKEMARVIDYLVQEARNMDIETMPEEELQSLLNSWG